MLGGQKGQKSSYRDKQIQVQKGEGMNRKGMRLVDIGRYWQELL